MIVYQAFAGPASQAAHLVLSRPNYVTKVVFPLHLLAWPAVAQAALNAAVSTVLLVLLHLVFVGAPAWTSCWCRWLWGQHCCSASAPVGCCRRSASTCATPPRWCA